MNFNSDSCKIKKVTLRMQLRRSLQEIDKNGDDENQMENVNCDQMAQMQQQQQQQQHKCMERMKQLELLEMKKMFVKKMESLANLQSKNNNDNKKQSNNKNLNSSSSTSSSTDIYTWLFDLRKLAVILGTITAFVLFSFTSGTVPLSKNTIIVNFLTTYKKIYYDLVYDCNKLWEPEVLIQQARETSNILNQDEALNKFELALRESSTKNYNAIAFVGTPGVGKTLFALNIVKNYPWPHNVHIYHWHERFNDNTRQIKALRFMVKDLFNCGINLLIIDNVLPSETDLLMNVRMAVTDVVGVDSCGGLKVRIIVIFIFTLRTIQLSNEAPSLHLQNSTLQNLPNTFVINFKRFTNFDVLECIRLESYLLNIGLTFKQYKSILNSLDFVNFGCKNVRSKVLMLASEYIDDDPKTSE